MKTLGKRIKKNKKIINFNMLLTMFFLMQPLTGSGIGLQLGNNIPTKEEWTLFYKETPENLMSLWQANGKKLSEWHWQWRLAWIRFCRKTTNEGVAKLHCKEKDPQAFLPSGVTGDDKDFMSCPTSEASAWASFKNVLQHSYDICVTEILRNGLQDKALVVRAESVDALGEIFAGKNDREVVGWLKKTANHSRNFRNGKPLYIIERILFSLSRIEGQKDHLKDLEKLRTIPSVAQYWERISKKGG